MDEQLLEVIISDFSQAVVSNIDEPDKPLNAFKEIKNARIDIKQGELTKRLQATYYNETSLGAKPIKSGVRFYYGTDSKELIISYDTFLKKGDDALGTFDENIKTELTPDKRWSFLTYKDKLYGCNGNDPNQRYDGTNIKNMGCQIPGSGMTATAVSGSGLEIGTYKYKVTSLYDGYQESNPQATSSDVTTTSGNQKVNLASIPVGAAGQSVTARKIYRTKVGASVYYLLTTINGNTTDTYVDTIADTDLGAEIKINHDIPPVWKMMVLHKGRIFGLKSNSCEVDYTTIEGYNSLPDIYDNVENYELINENDGEDVIAIAEVQEGIVCFKRSMTFIIRTYANDPETWSIDKIDVYGLASEWSIAKTAKGIIGLSIDKENQLDLRLWTGSGSSSLGYRVKDILDSINMYYLAEVVGAFYGGRYYLSYIDNIVGLEYNHKVSVLQFSDDFSRFGYTFDDLRVASFIPCFGAGDTGQMYAGMSDRGVVLRLETTSIDIIHKTKTDIATGTLTRLKSQGTEEYPEYLLDGDEMDGLFADTIIDDLSEVINSYNNPQIDMIDYSGYITSDILWIGIITSLKKAYWSVVGNSSIRIRTGDTKEACSTASWSELFAYNSNGVDISAITPKKYLQYQLYLVSDDNPDLITKLYRDVFVVKISAGLGSPFEEYINFLMDTGKLHLGYPDQIKRLRQVVIEYEGEGNTLYLYLAKDEDNFGSAIEQINLNTYPNMRQVILPFTFIGEYFDLKLVEESLNPLRIKSIRFRFSVLPKQSQILLRGRR